MHTADVQVWCLQICGRRNAGRHSGDDVRDLPPQPTHQLSHGIGSQAEDVLGASPQDRPGSCLKHCRRVFCGRINTGPHRGPYGADDGVGDPLTTRLATAGHDRRFVEHAVPGRRPRRVTEFSGPQRNSP